MSEFMSQLWMNFFSSGPFVPHGHCYLWQKDLVSLHLVSDVLIALAYYSIPTTLFYFVRKRQDLPFNGIFFLFMAFIIACGTTHAMDVWTLWYPTYWLSGSIKLVTATVSVFTALQLVPLVPKALALPSPAELEQANQKLQIQIGERLRVEEQLRKYQNQLEELVTLRTHEITKTNEKLQQEIAERQRILESLRQSEERYRYLVEAIPQLVWTTDAQGECDYFNQNWCEYTGLTSEQSLGSGWLVALHPEDMQIAHQVWLNSVKTGTLYESEYRFRRAADNSYRWQLARALPLKDEKGSVVKWFGTCTDIHEQKQVLQERAYLLQLEQAARAEAEAANRIKDEFLAILSHELRTPLNAILGWAQLLQQRRLQPAKMSQALATIERNAKLQAQLIEDLLDVSRILQGKLVLNTTKTNLKLTILPALETIRLAAESNLIQVNTIFSSQTLEVLGDPTRLQQVVSNLLSNAVKFTPQGGKVEVRLEEVDGYAQITVSDTGKGISAEFIPYVFDYFRQADSSSTRKFGGLGLGLAIVRNIIEMHGGQVKAESPGEGKGAKFTISLPLVREEKPSTTDEQNYAGKVANNLPLAGVKALVVDDDIDSRDFVAFVLEQDGAVAIAVSSVVEALEVLAQTKPDILVSDISMPDMDGYMLIEEVRTWKPEQGGEIPAIALTAFARNSDKEQVLKAGFQLHLTKPFNPEELVTAVVRILELEVKGEV